MPQDLRTLFAGTTAISGLVSTHIHYNKDIPQESTRPHIWFRIASDNVPLTMDGVGGMHDADVDLECAALTEASAQAVSDAVMTLHGYAGTMGNVSAKAIFIENKSDDYQPQLSQSNEGVHVIAHSVRVVYTT